MMYEFAFLVLSFPSFVDFFKFCIVICAAGLAMVPFVLGEKGFI